MEQDDFPRLLKNLEDERQKLRLLLDFIPAGLSISDSEGRVRFSNTAAERILALPRTTHESRKIDGQEWNVIRRDGTPMPLTEWPSVIALKESRLVEGVEMGIRRADGSIAWLIVSAIPTGIKDLEIAITYQDISRLVEQEEAVEASRRRFTEYLSHLPHAMIITDNTGAIVEVNSAFCELYGYSREEILGRTPAILNPGRRTYEDLGIAEEEYESLFQSLWESITDPAKGFWSGELVNRKKQGKLVRVRLEVRTIFGPDGKPRNHIGLPVDISAMRSRESSSKIDLFRTIADLAALRDNETGNHMKRVGIFARALAKSIGMPSKYCEDIEVFAPMHDIGKVGIPDAILGAPRKLDNSEFEQMKRHTVLGHDIVWGKPELELVAAITLHHHERWDGRGYPKGLAGEAIPLSARITTIADVYDALRSRRPYKEPWTHEEAVADILAGSGERFDPILVERFRELASGFDAIRERLSDK